jgi:hypothetical protein
MSNLNMKLLLPKDKTYVALSIPYKELNAHLTTMLNIQCHLTWIDCISINQINYFNLLWQKNYETGGNGSLLSTPSSNQLSLPCYFNAKTPQYMIFYDLNTAQLAQIYHEYTSDNQWNVQLVESYIKTPNASKKKVNQQLTDRKKSSKTNRINNRSSSAITKSSDTFQLNSSSNSSISSTAKSYDEIFYIVQFTRNIKSISNDINLIEKNKLINKLHHSIIDTRYNQVFKECVKYSESADMFIPLRISPLLVNVNTLTNKHFYYTCIYKRIKNYKPIDEFDFNEKQSNLKQTSLFHVCNGNSKL